MYLEKVQNKVKCDASGCPNTSEFRVVNKKFVFSGSVYLCKPCLEELYSMISMHITPKSPKPIYKKKGVENE